MPQWIVDENIALRSASGSNVVVLAPSPAANMSHDQSRNTVCSLLAHHCVLIARAGGTVVWITAQQLTFGPHAFLKLQESGELDVLRRIEILSMNSETEESLRQERLVSMITDITKTAATCDITGLIVQDIDTLIPSLDADASGSRSQEVRRYKPALSAIADAAAAIQEHSAAKSANHPFFCVVTFSSDDALCRSWSTVSDILVHVNINVDADDEQSTTVKLVTRSAVYKVKVAHNYAVTFVA